ncbi:hypothetical protein ACWGS9_29550 [Bradyrhizobium sp. Arg314]
MFKNLLALALVALALSGCVTDYKKINGKPFYGTTPEFAGWEQKKRAGLIPVSISCRMPRAGAAARAPRGSNLTTKWAKAPPSGVKWVVIFVGPQPEAEVERAHARAMGARKTSGGSFYQSVSKQQFFCEIWRTS